MKKCILSGLMGALLMFVALVAIDETHKNKGLQEYKHIDYISSITSKDCFVCSENGLYWGEDNVGIVNLNTFELLYMPINRYGDHGELIEEPAGVMVTGGLYDHEAESYVNANVFPDNAYAQIALSGVNYNINRESIQSNLCQTCLDTINNMWFTTQPPAEFAIVSFAKKTIQPLLNAQTWFAAGNYGIDCEFREDGAIDLLIHYAPFRYE